MWCNIVWVLTGTRRFSDCHSLLQNGLFWGPDTYHFEIEHIDSPSYPGADKKQRYKFFFQPKLVNWLFVFHHSTHLPYLSLKLLEKNPRTCISLPNTPRPSGYPGDRPKDECTRWFTVGFQHSISLVGLDTFMHCGLPVGSPRDSWNCCEWSNWDFAKHFSLQLFWFSSVVFALLSFWPWFSYRS